jgi:DNA polymerase I-like protein with 3'-5' exonuclease and polymerase domains
MAWMELAGLPVNAADWAARAVMDHQHAQALAADLTALVAQTVNWQSPTQVLALLQARGHSLTSTEAEALLPLAEADPVIVLLLDFRAASKRASTYGEV